MKYSFTTIDKKFTYTFNFDYNEPDWIDIETYEMGKFGGAAWTHRIKNGRIIWRHDDFMKLTPEAKDYISDIIQQFFNKYKAFL